MTDRTYLRISLDTAQSGSIVKQRSRLSALAVDPVEYADESVSGSKIPFAERPAGSRLLGDLERGDRVLVTRIDRAARNVRDLLDLVERIEGAGASVVFVDQAIDTAGPMGRFLLTLLGAIAELEAGIIAERRRESLAAFRDEGRHAVGRAPFGLRSVPKPDGRGLVLRPDPEEAPVMREIFERLLAGESQRSLFPLAGMQAPAFSRLLRNERLAGILGYDERGPRLDPDMAIFSLVEWRRLQDYLRRPAKGWSRTDGYGAALACGVCGDRLYFNRAGKPEYATYRCRKVKHAPGEPGLSVIRANADERVEEDFLRRFGHVQVFERVTVDSSAEKDEAVALARLSLEAAQAALVAAATEADEAEAFTSVRVAKRALRDAEALPSESVTETRPTGLTFAQVWESADDDERTGLLLQVGPWVVSPGRGLPIEEKVFLPEAPDYLSGQV